MTKPVDSIGVVRCKECEHNANREGDCVVCKLFPMMNGESQDHYCAMAVKAHECYDSRRID